MERKRSIRRRQPPSFSARAKSHCRSFTAFMFSNVGIIFLVVLYTIAGSFMFKAIEENYAQERSHSIEKEKQSVISKLWKISCCEENPSDKSEYMKKIHSEIKRYQEIVVNASNKGWQGGETKKDNKTSNPWTFSGAFLYSLTVITTIGYGNLAPQTNIGKIVTIFYAMVGMPLFLLYLSNIGDILAKSFKWVYARCCLCQICPGVAKRRALRERSKQTSLAYLESYHMPFDQTSYNPSSQSETDIDEESIVDENKVVIVPLTVCIAIMIGYIIFGAFLFARWENWELLDGSYFCFISLSSIGFGDFVPGLSLKTSDDKERLVEVSFILCAVYLLLGMALIAMCFSLMQEQVVHKIKAIQQCIKNCFRCRRHCR